MNERQIMDLLRGAPLPDAREAEERGWRVVRAAYEQRAPGGRPGRRLYRLAIAIAIGALILALALTPAGAKVADLVRDIVQPGEENTRPLSSLPAPGRLLVNSAQGPWVVDEDGSKRLLGTYDDATWSPHGYFVAVTRGHELTAVEPDGSVHWSLASNAQVSDPRWAPSGFRIAYRAGGSLRVVTGDGTGDHLLARGIAAPPPAWRPISPRAAKASPTGAGTNVLAFATVKGRVEVIDADSRKPLWRSDPGPTPIALAWSADSRRLLALSKSAVRVYTTRGQLVRTKRLPPGLRATTGEFAPTGNTFAMVGSSTKGRSGSEALLLRLGSAHASLRRLFADPGRFTAVAWSPNGRWLLIAWRDADQWLFVRPAKPKQIKAVGNISRQFSPGTTAPSAFPGIAGWCCTTSRPSTP